MINTFEVELSYEDMVKFYTTVTVESKLSKKAFEKRLEDDTDYLDKVMNQAEKWEEDSVGSGFDIEVDSVTEIGKDNVDQKIMCEITIKSKSQEKARKILEKWLEKNHSFYKTTKGTFHIEN